MLENIKIALADDHNLFRKGIAELINAFPGYEVVLEASDGASLIGEMKKSDIKLQIIILDINMKPQNGYETAKILKETNPDIKILALSMYDDENSILKMIKSGAHGYVLKDADPEELKRALDELRHKGFYYSNVVGEIMLKNMQGDIKPLQPLEELLKEREIEFLKLACSELTYKEIADRMNLAPRTIDGYREALFEKLHAKNRIGLVITALKNGLISL